MNYPDNPAKEIEEALRILTIAIGVQIGYTHKRIDLSYFSQDIPINKHTGAYLVGQDITLFNMENILRNTVFSSLGTVALAVDSALDDKFGGVKRVAEDYSEISCFRNSMHMIRCAFAHGPSNPIWECKNPNYLKAPYVFSLEKKSERIGIPDKSFEKMKFEFDFKKLNKKGLNFADFNGLDGIFLLAEHAQKLVS